MSVELQGHASCLSFFSSNYIKLWAIECQALVFNIFRMRFVLGVGERQLLGLVSKWVKEKFDIEIKYLGKLKDSGAVDETRTRDPLRDRQVF